jgi:AraC-like DNA-binding protein
MKGTALATAIQPLWTLMEDYNVDPEPIFRASGIDAELLKRPNARLPTEACNAVWLRASNQIEDPCFGVKYGPYWHPSMFGPLGYAWLASTSLRKALNRLAKYTDLVLERGAVEIINLENGDASITLSYLGSAFTLPALADSLLSLVMHLCRINYEGELNPKTVTLFHSAPPDPGAYFNYFSCPVEFDAEHDSIILAKTVLDEQLPGGNSRLASINEHEAVRYLAQLDNSRIVDRVQAAIIEQLSGGGVTSESVAQALHVSNRTLNRQLQKESTTFRDLFQRTRCKLADAYLADDYYSITEIAFMLGFSEQSAFTRAYRRWTGKVPSDVRV